ncbi:MAG TPA: glucosidase, partial [Chloroflexota bacterium]|nr:glucosidase [Chloroflexota bacterium]
MAGSIMGVFMATVISEGAGRGERVERAGYDERDRLESDPAAWRRWGPYLSERAWGTVREDYSADGSAWDHFPHDHARSRVYRWNEDGLLGISDDHQRLCFAVAMWNGKDPILKERLFGTAGPEGNHGEDVKECYWYLDSTPTHSIMRALYRYPHAAYPYSALVRESRRRARTEPEYELTDTGIFEDNRFFDVLVEYAKSSPRDILIRITATNHGSDAATLHLIPQLWFRNTWNWGDGAAKPQLHQRPGTTGVDVQHNSLGRYVWVAEGADEVVFTDNETNGERLWGSANATPYVKDAFHRYVISGEAGAVNPTRTGTKAAALYRRTLAPGETWTVRLRLVRAGERAIRKGENAFNDFDSVFERRRQEGDAFYEALQPDSLTQDERMVQRQAFAGLMWSKQYYRFNVYRWLHGDPGQPPPPEVRKQGRNKDWRHLNCADVISMPDTWEYPWFAAWDLAFHCIPIALIDSRFAKDQLLLLLREWYQHPNGDVPSYEWALGDSNPPVLAWAARRVFEIDKRQRGEPDLQFLERVFHKLLLNFTWWVNRKDSEGNNVFEGGFLGLDNIGVFDRSAKLPGGGHLEQSDGTSWMAMFALNLLSIALELASHNPVYEDIATKFFEHFLHIAAAMNTVSSENHSLWDEQDEFFYDVLKLPGGEAIPLRVRSLVGLIPLLAVETIPADLLEKVPSFKTRLEWVLKNRPELASLVSRWFEPGMGDRRLLALVRGHRMKCLLHRALDPEEFLSDHGIRSLSRYHAGHPYSLNLEGQSFTVSYEPRESQTGLFGGNSNWRGPIWLPINFLLIEALREFHAYYSDD